MATTERVGIEIELMGYESTISRMEALERKMRGLGGRRVRLQVEARVKDLQGKLRGLRSEAAKLQEKMRTAGKGEAFNELKSKLAQVRSEIRLTSAEINNLKGALRNVPLRSFGQDFRNYSSKIGHMGAAMQSFGNGITRMTAPLRMLTSGALLGAGFSAINKVTEGLSSGFSRYDTMKKYPRMMETLGYDSEKAQKSIDDLEKSVRGLPTGLDEMVNMSQRFTMTTGDMEKGTKLAIATNNAFLASMSTDTQKYQGMMQMQDVIGGKKMNAREWQALANSMMPAIRMMGQSLGKSGDDLNEWVAKVQQGKISNEEFIDALVKAGGKGGKIEEVAQLSKDTWQAFSANIGNAFSRMTAGVIESMDEIVKVATGGKFDSVNAFLADKVIPTIDGLTQKAKDWIKANPDEIINFFKDLKKFDWAGLGRGFLDGIKMIGQGIKSMIDWGSEKGIDTEKIGKIMALLPLIGSGLSSIGGLIKGTRHVWGFLGAGAAGIAGGSILGNLGMFFTGIASLKGLGKAEKNLKKVEKISKIGGKAGIGSVFKGFLPVLEGIAGVGLATIEIAGTAAIDAKLLHIAVDNITGIVQGMKDVFKEAKGLKKAYKGVNKGEIQTAVNDFFDLYSIIRGQETTASKGAKGLTKGAGGGQKTEGTDRLDKGYLSNMADSMGHLVDIFDKMKEMSKAVKKLKGFKGFDDEVRTGIGNYVKSIGSIYNELDQRLDGISPERAQEFTGIMDSAKGLFKGIADMVKGLPELTKKIQKVTEGGRRNNSTMWELKNALIGENGLFGTLNEIYSSVINDLMGNGTEGERLTADGKGTFDIGKLSGVMANVNEMFSSIGSVLDQMPGMLKKLNKLNGLSKGNVGTEQHSKMSGFTTMILDLIGRLKEVVSAVNSMGDTGNIEAKVTAVSNAVDTIQTVVGKLKSLGGGELASTDSAAFTAANNISALVESVGNALNSEGVTGLRAQVDTFSQTVDAMFDALNKAFSNIKVTVKITTKVDGVDEAVRQINSAGNRIRLAVSGLPSTINHTVNVHVNPNVTTGSYSLPKITPNTGGRNLTPTSYQHTGGVIYRAGGGDVPRGTDTVRAWLTPGEFVQRKKAVDFFGLEFMRSVNNLDLGGAMRALTARAGMRTTTIYNTTNNNNVTQNIKTSNPNFAYKRSNRFVMAL